MAVFPADSIRTKTWGTELLTSSDLHAQLDLLHNYIKASLDSASGHDHSGTANQSKKLSPANLVIASQAAGDTLYASSATAWARLAKGTAGQVLKMNAGATAPEWGTGGGGTTGSYKNLKVVRTNVTTVTVTADELVLDSGTKITSVNEAAAITTSGAGGLDTGAEGNVWYYIWIIRKSADGTVDALLSASASSPTMPAGYDQKALVSAVHNTAGDFVDFVQEGHDYFYSSWVVAATGNVGASQSVNIAEIVPSGISTLARGTQGVVYGYVSVSNLVSSVGDATTIAINKFISEGLNTPLNGWELNTLTPNTLYWCSAYSTGALYISGFRINKL